MTKPITNVCEPSVVLPKVADKSTRAAESSPEGHWSKNFAAFAVHRRKDWAVSVKGFNKFVWDFEEGKDENEYGMFGSNGAMLIANSEDSLKVHDLDNGWDWTKIPGATTISLQPDMMKRVSARNFSPKSIAGGVTFTGEEALPNGVFGMDFNSPTYEMDPPRKSRPKRLFFKKSFFFFQNLVVCLGSGIRLRTQSAQTTLFQDKLEDGVAASFIKVNGNMKLYGDTFTATTPAVPSGKSHVSLQDTKGNSYYIPQSSVSDLKVHIQDQSPLVSTGRYATAWFEHGTTPGSYQYAAFVKTNSYDMDTAKHWREQDNNGLYDVLKVSRGAHVVKFLKSFVGGSSSQLTNPVFGYFIFNPTATLPSTGPIKMVSEKCLLMAQETSGSLHLSVSYPDLDLSVREDFSNDFADVGPHELYEAESQAKSITVTLQPRLKMTTGQASVARVHGQHSAYTPTVNVPPDPSSAFGTTVVLKNLMNGFSVEVTLTKYTATQG